MLVSLVFSGNANPMGDVMIGGRWLVRDGRHRGREAIAEVYRATRRLSRPGRPEADSPARSLQLPRDAAQDADLALPC